MKTRIELEQNSLIKTYLGRECRWHDWGCFCGWYQLLLLIHGVVGGHGDLLSRQRRLHQSNCLRGIDIEMGIIRKQLRHRDIDVNRFCERESVFKFH